MKPPFEINFDFEVATSGLIIPLRATAELHHSVPYYVVNDVRQPGHKPTDYPVLPEFEIKRVERDGNEIWVHCDTEQETLLSLAAGRAIEKALKKLNRSE